MINKNNIIDAYLFLRENNHSIPTEVLDFMKEVSLASLEKMNNTENSNCFANKGDSEENMQADMQREIDADRWNALINSPFRLFGTAGLNNDDPTLPCEKYGKDGYAHFGCEMWTKHNGYKDSAGKEILIGFADQAIKAQELENKES